VSATWIFLLVLLVLLAISLRPRRLASNGNSSTRGENESERLKRLIEEKRAIPQQLGLEKAVVQIWKDLQHYPTWIGRGQAPALVTRAVEREIKPPKYPQRSAKAIDATILGKEYSFQFGEYTLEHNDNGIAADLDIHVGGQTVFAISMFREFNEYSSEWKPTVIRGFLDGDWISSLMQLSAEITERNAKFDHDFKAKWLKDQAKQFGIAVDDKE